jgi:hypothetical protein
MRALRQRHAEIQKGVLRWRQIYPRLAKVPRLVHARPDGHALCTACLTKRSSAPMEESMRYSTKASLFCGLLLGSSLGFAAQRQPAEPVDETDAESPSVESSEPNELTPDPDNPFDGRRFWYCSAAPSRWAGHWNGRDYEAFGRFYWRVHEIAERKCERFHRRCFVSCERRHSWEWDGGFPGHGPRP